MRSVQSCLWSSFSQKVWRDQLVATLQFTITDSDIRNWGLVNSANLSKVPNVTVRQMNLWMRYENIQGALKWHSAYQHLELCQMVINLCDYSLFVVWFICPVCKGVSCHQEKVCILCRQISRATLLCLCSIWNHAFYNEFPTLKSFGRRESTEYCPLKWQWTEVIGIWE